MEIIKWLSRDPLGEGVGPNLYAYVDNSPVNLLDALGLTPGDPFSTPAAAAADALNYINPQSIADNTEYGGTVYFRQFPGHLRWRLLSSGALSFRVSRPPASLG